MRRQSIRKRANLEGYERSVSGAVYQGVSSMKLAQEGVIARRISLRKNRVMRQLTRPVYAL